MKGDFGSAPRVTFASPTKVPTSSVDDLITGKGSAITAKNQPFVIDVALYDAKTGESLGSTGFDGSTQVADITMWDGQLKTIGDASGAPRRGPACWSVPGAHRRRGRGGRSRGRAEGLPPHAEGSLVYNDALGLPTVVRAPPDGRPGIIIPDARSLPSR